MDNIENIDNVEPSGFKTSHMTSLKFTPVSRVTPGRLTKRTFAPIQKHRRYQSEEVQETKCQTENIATNVLTLRSNEGVLEIHVDSLEMTTDGLRLAKKIKNDPQMHLTWAFMDFGETILTKPLGNTELHIFDYSVLYKIDVNVSFLQYIQSSFLKISLYVKNDYQMEYIGSSDLSLKEILEKPGETITTRLIIGAWDGSMEISHTSLMKSFATLSMWYKLNYKTKTGASLEQELREDLDFSYSTDSELESPISSTNTVKTVKKSFMTSGQRDSLFAGIKPTDSEVMAFQDALNLVLSRNKALRTTQSEISNELAERTKWLHEESNWKRTLQEHAILSGNDPYKIGWRQWRDQNTGNVKLRNYPSQRVLYESVFIIKIIGLKFFKKTSVVLDQNIKQLYVEYSFLGHEGPEMETPSLLKNTDETLMVFNFTKEFPIDLPNDKENCKMLADFISRKELINFMVVSEPIRNEAEVQVCEEVGICSVNLFDLVQYEANEDIDNYEVRNIKKLKEIIGYLKIGFKGIQAVRRAALLLLAPSNYNIIV